MDLPTPTPPPPISGYRSRAINAAVDFAAALRPVAGPGVRVADGPGGKTISVDPRGLADVPRPWTVRVVPLVGAAPSQVEWSIRVYGGLVVLGGAQLTPPTADGTDEATGLDWYDAPEQTAGSQWLCVAHDGEGGWALAWKSSPASAAAGAEHRAIARLVEAGPPPRLAQMDLGVVDLGGGSGGGVSPGAGSGETPKYLRGYGAEPNGETWAYGDTDPQGRPYYPVFSPLRLLWDVATARLLAFARTATYNSSGLLVSVSAEEAATVFTAVPEMP